MTDRTSPLGSAHADAGARFTTFGGWDMPVSFDSIGNEHDSVREAAGKFDVSHMGEIEVTGPDAASLMDRLTSNDVHGLVPGQGQYAMITDEEGVMLDDTVLYRRGPESFLFVPNAGHDAEMTERWETHRDAWDLDALVRNATEEWAMFAIQGPEAPALVEAVTAETIADLGRFGFREAAVAGVEGLVSNSGYTGEDGYEVLCPWGEAETVWNAFDCQPCGLGARDTLRLEMGFLLSGQDFHPEDDPRTPYEGNVGFAVDLESDFVGRDALREIRAAGVSERIVGLELTERGVPRHGYAIETPEGEVIGEVTSGTMSPTLDVPIALGYVPVEYTQPDTPLSVRIRGEPKEARTRATPFL